MKMLYGQGLSDKTALITDGRFSGTNNGCFVGHISPEAAEGGPLAAVRDGDLITVDIPGRQVNLEIGEGRVGRAYGRLAASLPQDRRRLPRPLRPLGHFGRQGRDHSPPHGLSR